MHCPNYKVCYKSWATPKTVKGDQSSDYKCRRWFQEALRLLCVFLQGTFWRDANII